MATLFENAPNLEVLRLKPVYCGNGGFRAGYYAFKWLQHLFDILKLAHQKVKESAGYFRKNNSQLDPPWTQGCRIGNTNGLTLVVYMINYNARSGFYNNNKRIPYLMIWYFFI